MTHTSPQVLFNSFCISLLVPFCLPESLVPALVIVSMAAVILISVGGKAGKLNSGLKPESTPATGWSIPSVLQTAFLGILLSSLVLLFVDEGRGFQEAPGPGRAGILEGVVASDAQVRSREGHTWYSLKVKKWCWTDFQGRKFQVPESATALQVLLFTRDGAREPGSEAGRPGNFGCLVFQGDQVRIALDSWCPQQITPGGQLLDVQSGRGLDGLRSHLLKSVIASMASLSPQASGLVLALLLGRQDFIQPQDQAIFLKTGCVHLIALSGMHVTLVLGLGMGLFSLVFGGFWGRIGGLAAVCILLWLVGPFPSAVRALLMCLWAGLGRLVGYRIDQKEALGLAGLTLLVIQPSMLGQLGYQLSALTLYGMMFFQNWLDQKLRPVLRPVPAAKIAPGLAAQAASMPLLLANGLSWYPQGILAGLLLEPLCLVLLACGALQCIMSILGCLPFLELPVKYLDSTFLVPLTEMVFQLTKGCGSLFVWFP